MPLFDWIVLSDSARRDICHEPSPWSELSTIHLELHLSFPDEAISGADASLFPAQVEQWFQNGAGAYHQLGWLMASFLLMATRLPIPMRALLGQDVGFSFLPGRRNSFPKSGPFGVYRSAR